MTLEKNILPPYLRGLQSGTFRSRVIPATTTGPVIIINHTPFDHESSPLPQQDQSSSSIIHLSITSHPRYHNRTSHHHQSYTFRSRVIPATTTGPVIIISHTPFDHESSPLPQQDQSSSSVIHLSITSHPRYHNRTSHHHQSYTFRSRVIPATTTGPVIIISHTPHLCDQFPPSVV